MAIWVEIPQIFRKHTNGSKVITVEAETIREVFERLDDTYPGLRKQLFTDDGELHRFVNVYLNEEDIRYLRYLETPLKGGDRLSILPAVAGGRPAGGLRAVGSGRAVPRRPGGRRGRR